jgi:hypothetical protein
LLSIHATLLVDHASNISIAMASRLTDSATTFRNNIWKHLARADHFLLACCCPIQTSLIRRRGSNIFTPESAHADAGA